MDRQKVLVIDDSELIHRLVEARLKDLAVDICRAMDGETGLEMVERDMPDLILLDVTMPGLSGFEVCQRLKDNAQTRDIPVVFLTGLDESADKVKGFALGAIDYVTKPFDPAELLARVRAALCTKSLMDLLASQAQIDGLSGLHNRRYFDQRLGQELDAARRHDRIVGLLLIDIDKFKTVNDTFGHPKGDQVIHRVAQIIGETCRQSDVPCRYGGDEFALILLEASWQHTHDCAARLIEQIRADEQLKAIIDHPVTLSVGAAACEPPTILTAEQLIELADKALYESKSQGRDRLTVHPAASDRSAA